MKVLLEAELDKIRKSFGAKYGQEVVEEWESRRRRLMQAVEAGYQLSKIAAKIDTSRQTLDSIKNKPTPMSRAAKRLDAWLDENAPEKPVEAAQGQFIVSTDALDAGNIKRLETGVLNSLTGILANPHCSLIGKTQAILDHADALKDLRVEGTDHD